MTLLGPDRLHDLAATALAAADEADAEALLVHETGGLTRFAANRIHQSTSREDLELRIRVVRDGGRTGVASSHDLSRAGVRATARRAAEVALRMPADPAYPGMAEPADLPAVHRYDEATGLASPVQRAELIAGAVRRLPDGVEAAGSLETGAVELAVANRRGVHATFTGTRAAFALLADAGTGTGHGEEVGSALDRLDVGGVADRAAAAAVAARNPRELPPGTYPVVLEPAATATLVQFLSYLGFSAKAYDEQRSFLCGRLHTRVCSELVTIVDDVLAPDALGPPFDFEGIPKRPVAVIDHGVAANLLYDLRSARRHGVPPTGHGLPAPSSEGAFALNPRLLPGTTPAERLTATIDRGLKVTRFHYTNVVNPMDTTITGMTRDGTFLIEEGAVVGAVRNLRFTQSILDALDAVRAVGDRAQLASELFFGAASAPALAVEAFTFSSATTF